MSPSLEINDFSLFLSAGLLVVAILISAREKLGLEKEIIIAGIRAVIQLFIVGYILEYIFAVNNLILTLAMVAFIIFNASYNAHKRSKNIDHSLVISLISIGGATIITLIILVFSGAIKFVPSQIVPITGMVASNAMIAVGLVYQSLNSKFKDQRQQVLEKLALGANKKQASLTVVRESIKTGMQPSIDSTKTVGLVALPGMMSGLMFAGVSPTAAIRYQMVIMFMLISVTSISCIIAAYMSYKRFYNEHKQLLI